MHAAASPATNPVTKSQESYSQSVLGDTLNNYELKGDNSIESKSSANTLFGGAKPFVQFW